MKPFIVVIILFISSNSFSQKLTENTLQISDTTVIEKNELKAFDWLIGSWKTNIFGGTANANWMPSSGGSMMCAFKLIKDNKVVFYELVTLSEEKENLILRLKHFDNDLKGWEEKNEVIEFKMIKQNSNKFYFEDWTFEKINDTEMNIYVVINREGEKQEMKFNYLKDSI